MKNIFNQIELQGKSYDVIVATKYGSSLCSASGDMIFHTEPLLNTGMNGLHILREVKPDISIRKSSNKRSAVSGSRRSE